jgi:hypothetical protein
MSQPVATSRTRRAQVARRQRRRAQVRLFLVSFAGTLAVGIALVCMSTMT